MRQILNRAILQSAILQTARIVIFILCTALFVAETAMAGDLEDGLEACKQSFYDKALRLLIPLAIRGNQSAIRCLGIVNRQDDNGAAEYKQLFDGVSKYEIYLNNHSQELLTTFNSLKPMADKGNGIAQDIIGDILYDGSGGVPEDRKSGVEMYESAAKQGFVHAQWNLGYIYRDNNEFKDYKKSFKYFLNAANNNDDFSIQKMCEWNFSGYVPEAPDMIISKDYALAAKYCPLAIDAGFLKDAVILGQMYENGLGLDVNYDESAKFYKIAVDNKIVDGMLKLASLYIRGAGVPQDYTQAEILFNEAIKKYGASTEYDIGKMYKAGDGVPQDYKKAAKWFLQAAEHGYGLAQWEIAVMYQDGQGVAQDYSAELKWYNILAESETFEALFYKKLAQNNLGVMYSKGQGVVKDDKIAAQWFIRAALNGNDVSQNNLGNMYYYGQGVIQNYIKAHEWYNISASNGNANALQNRNNVSKLLSTTDLVKAQTLAQQCLQSNYKNCD